MKNKILLFALMFLCLSSNLLAQRSKSKNIQFRAKLPFGTTNSDLSNIGGYVDSLGNEYALVGWKQGLKIVDVTNPDLPKVIKNIPGNTSDWREVKTRGRYAYVTTEGGGGLQIINLSSLPDSNGIQVKQWKPNYQSKILNTIHALHIDRHFLYLYGSNIGNGGALVCDISNPWFPSIVGFYDYTYVHDGFVLNDTLYACHIYDGFFTMVDMSNKANPTILAQQNTPKNYTHNSWLTTNHKTLLTTDEVDDSYVVAYDISDPSNITELDRVQSQNAGSLSIGHNVHVLNDYAVTSWYKDGVVIIDAHKPDNLVVVGWYDTSPLSGGGFDGAWGVYPFLPSGNLVVSDISEGLYVLTPTYKRACYFEGTVMDSVCMQPLNGVKIQLVGPDTVVEYTSINGIFKMGTPDPGNYLVVISKQGYSTKTYQVTLTPGMVTNLNISLSAPMAINLQGFINDNNNNPIGNAFVELINANNQYTATTNSNGQYEKCGVVADNYSALFGKWGYVTKCTSLDLLNSNYQTSETLNQGYYDDFSFNFNWTVNTTASTGSWEIGIPNGTSLSGFPFSNPNVDVSTDCGNRAYVTGNDGSSAGDDDVDDGYTDLLSPVMDLNTYSDPYINYYRWFVNGGGNTQPNDSMLITLTNGITTVYLEKITASTPNPGTWVYKSFRVKDYFSTNLNQVQLKIHIQDYLPGHIVEGGFDKFEISDNFSTKITNHFESSPLIYPNPFNESFTIENKENLFSSVVITDLAGKEVYKSALSSPINIITIALNKGVYFVKLQSNNQTNVVKLIKQ